jgi:WD40 repeat protein
VLKSTPTTEIESSNAVDITPGGRLIHGSHTFLRGWNPVDGELCWEVKETGVFGRLVCGGCEQIAVVRNNRCLHYFNAATGRLVASGVFQGEGLRVFALAFSPSGETLAVAAGKDLVLWNVATWTEMKRVHLPDSCTRLAYRPDGSELFGFTGSSICAWEPDLARKIRMYDFRLNSVLDFTFDPTSQLAAAGCYDGRVVVWDLE